MLKKIKIYCNFDFSLELEHEKQIELYIDMIPNSPGNSSLNRNSEASKRQHSKPKRMCFREYWSFRASKKQVNPRSKKPIKKAIAFA